SIHRRGWARTERALAERYCRSRAPASAECPCIERDYRGLVEHRQQRARGTGAETVHRPAPQPAKSLAHRGDGVHARRQFRRSRLGGEPDRRTAGAPARGRDRLLGILQGRRAADGHYDRRRRAVACFRLNENDRRSRAAFVFSRTTARLGQFPSGRRQGGLGPYLGIYLLTQQHWNQAAIGFVATTAGIVGLAMHTPIGAFIDVTRSKRGAIIAGLAILSLSALTIAPAPIFPVVLAAQVMMAIAGAVFGPAIAAITLGVLGTRGLAHRMGRNAAFDHAGNVFIAVLAGAVGWYFSQRAVFWLVPFFSVLAAAAVLSVPAAAIDHARARGLARSEVD